jgi:hypothetical protein
MSNVIEYFKKVSYKHTLNMGDRVRGVWQGVPFTGSVAIDTMVDTDVGPYVMVFLDLPIKLENSYHSIIKVIHSDLIEQGKSYGINRKTNSKKSVVGSNKQRQ